MPATLIPLVDLDRQHAPLRAAIEAELGAILADGTFVGGPQVEAFETEFARYVGRCHCVGVANGTDALLIALEALGIGRGDEVIVPAMTFFATAEAVCLAGAVPVFCDVDPATANLDPSLLAARIGPRTRAVLPVHLYGRPAPMLPILEVASTHGLKVIEDCAQAQGARTLGRQVGSFGDLAAFSFYPSKNLGAIGDAGAVVTDDAELARTCRMLGSHGGRHRYEHRRVGRNSRLDAVQAAVLRLKLPRLDRWNAERRELAERYRARLADLAAVEMLAGAGAGEHAHHLFVVRVGARDRVREALRAQGVMAEIHYPDALPRVTALAGFGARPGDFPAAEDHAARCLSLPIFPGMREDEIDRVADALRQALAA